jgi:uncharacterized GH25 family protein
MKKVFLLLTTLMVFSSHDMFLRLDTYFLQPNAPAAIKLYNGTFDKSENVITRDRMADVSLVGKGARTQVDTSQWSERDNMTILSFNTGQAGTWVAGVSTRPRSIALAAADFNSYLEHDGVIDMLDWRKEHNAMDQDAVEKYSKHVKTIFQVGEELTDDWQTILGYPLEFVPLSHPYDLHPGHDLEVRLLWQGQPLSNQLVYVGSEGGDPGHSHEHVHTDEAEHEHEHTDEADNDHGDEHAHAGAEAHEHSHDAGHEHSHEDAPAQAAEADHQHQTATQLRTDAEGKVKVNITNKGIWYLRTIYLQASEESGLTHESNWATLTFEVGDGLGHSHDEVAHSHEDESGISPYYFGIGSLLLIGILFFFFNRKRT